MADRDPQRLRDAVHAAEAADDRDDALALRGLAAQAEGELGSVGPAERGRSFAWFLTTDGTLDRRFTFQLPVRRSAVVWDDSPLVAPLADLGDRGWATGLILVSLDAVRLLHWEVGEVSESEHSEFTLDTGDWRRYQRGAGRGGGRGAHAADQREAFDARVEAHREKLAAAAGALGTRLAAEGIDHVVVAGAAQVGSRFVATLPNEIAGRVLATVETDLADAAPAQVAERLEPEIESARAAEIAEVAERAASATAPEATGRWDPRTRCSPWLSAAWRT
ncbi:MAG: VLRF1 family aeRF1-type release factor [Solirubrobacteraceae bacterium]